MSRLPDCYFQNDLRFWVLDLVRQKMPVTFRSRDVLDAMLTEVPVTMDKAVERETLRRINDSLKSLVGRNLLTVEHEQVPDYPVLRSVYTKTDTL
jgi:hypothetical protein